MSAFPLLMKSPYSLSLASSQYCSLEGIIGSSDVGKWALVKRKGHEAGITVGFVVISPDMRNLGTEYDEWTSYD